MRFVAIEYKDGLSNVNVKGYLRIPENFPGNWSTGYRSYLRDKLKVVGPIQIYPLNVHSSPDTMGKPPLGYTNMEDDFNLALRSNIYYPYETSDSIRRAWSMMDPMSLDYRPKER